MKIDLNLFTVFEAIYSEGSLTKAAERLNLTQPAISHALSRLRERLDDPLFVRQGHKMRPTPLAQNLLPTIQNALSQLKQALQTAHVFDPSQADKTFRIAMRDVMESSFIPAVSSALESTAPSIRIASVHMERREMEAKLASGEWDFAVDVLTPTPSTLRQTKLVDDELVVLRNPQASQQTLTKDSYLCGKHVVVSGRATGPSLVDYALNTLGLRRDIHLRCQHYFSACLVAQDSDLLLTIPKQYATTLCQHFPKLSIEPLPFDTPNVDVYIYWHETMDQDQGNLWFRQFVMNRLQSLTQDSA